MIDVDLIPFEIVDPNCGRVAAYLRRMPNPWEPRRAADVVLLNGDPAEPHSTVRCGSCGEPFSPLYKLIRPRVTA